MDDQWYDRVDPLTLPPFPNEVCRLIDSVVDSMNNEDYESIQNNWESTYRLTVHAVDIQTCRVLTFIEGASGKCSDWRYSA